MNLSQHVLQQIKKLFIAKFRTLFFLTEAEDKIIELFV